MGQKDTMIKELALMLHEEELCADNTIISINNLLQPYKLKQESDRSGFARTGRLALNRVKDMEGNL